MRYVLHPGYITSKVDDQLHFISGPALVRAYGIDVKTDRYIFGDVPHYREEHGDIHLHPRFDGDYTLPNA